MFPIKILNLCTPREDRKYFCKKITTCPKAYLSCKFDAVELDALAYDNDDDSDNGDDNGDDSDNGGDNDDESDNGGDNGDEDYALLIDEVDKLWKNHNSDLVASHSPFDSWSEIFSLFVLAATDKIQLFHIFII